MLYCSLRRCLSTLTPGCGLWWCQCLDLSQTPLRLTSGCSPQSCKHNLWSEWFMNMILHQAWVWFLSPTELPWFYWKVPGNWVSFLCSLRYINSQQRTIISSQRLSFPSSIYNLRWQNWLDCQDKCIFVTCALDRLKYFSPSSLCSSSPFYQASLNKNSLNTIMY